MSSESGVVGPPPHRSAGLILVNKHLEQFAPWNVAPRPFRAPHHTALYAALPDRGV